MKNRFRLYRRKKGGMYYAHDSETGKQESLGTKDRAEATTLLNARNESFRAPQLNLHIASLTRMLSGPTMSSFSASTISARTCAELLEDGVGIITE